MNYKSFNLEQAKAQNGEGLITRDGRPARITCFDRLTSGDYCLVVLIPGTTGKEELPHFYNKNGQSWQGPHNFEMGEERSDDLFMAPNEHKGWVNVYSLDNKIIVGNGVYSTEKEAQEHIMLDSYKEKYLGASEISWEE